MFIVTVVNHTSGCYSLRQLYELEENWVHTFTKYHIGTSWLKDIAK